MHIFRFISLKREFLWALAIRRICLREEDALPGTVQDGKREIEKQGTYHLTPCRTLYEGKPAVRCMEMYVDGWQRVRYCNDTVHITKGEYVLATVGVS